MVRVLHFQLQVGVRVAESLADVLDRRALLRVEVPALRVHHAGTCADVQHPLLHPLHAAGVPAGRIGVRLLEDRAQRVPQVLVLAGSRVQEPADVLQGPGAYMLHARQRFECVIHALGVDDSERLPDRVGVQVVADVRDACVEPVNQWDYIVVAIYRNEVCTLYLLRGMQERIHRALSTV